MSLRRRRFVPFTVGVSAAVALLVTGCTSTGTVGPSTLAGNSTSSSSQAAPSSAGHTSIPASPSNRPTTSVSVSSTDSGAEAFKMLETLIHDPGCKLALTGLEDFANVAQSGTPQQILIAFPPALKKMRDGAATTKKPGAKAAITKMADDLQKAYNDAKAGRQPDVSMMSSDGGQFGAACAG